MKYRIRAIPGGYEAAVPIQLPDGARMVVSARAYFAEVRRDLARRRGGVQGCYEQATTEGFFGDIGRFVKKVTKSKALRKVVRTVGKVVKHPAFAAGVALIPGVGVPLAGGIQAAVAAEKLISNATKAPKGSRKRIAARTIIKAAQTVAKRESKQRRMGRNISRRRSKRGRTPEERAFRYLVQLAPAA